MKETKTASGSPEARAALHEMMAAFEAFKGANDARLDEIEKKTSADVLLEQKVARIDQAVASAQARLDRVVSEASAFRGTAYVVFEDLPLGPFGNRVPQLAFEVFRRPRGSAPVLEDRLEGVCLIPGAGEFVLATEAVMRRDGLTRTTAENVNNAEGRADLLVSLDQLEAQCPNLKRVSLVIGWFGDSLSAGECTIRPGVERRDKATEPLTWSVAGLDRSQAHLISQAGDGPAYGGTPSDDSVRQAVAELKARGWAVTLYPFVFMDAADYPWRGRIAGRHGAEATGDVAALFGTADGWGLRRLALHYAQLATETGADGLLIGSEMRGLTTTRGADGGFPAVAAFRTLAAECRAVVGPGVALSYAADWSEYAGVRSGGEVLFHLDQLWADVNIDHVAIDWYPPLGDWRDDGGGLDAALFEGASDPAYLATQIAGGEGFDWFYATEADRAAQARTPIHDTAHGEDWVFRVKDLVGWWSNAHHDRPGGIRSATPTPWVPGMKPIRLTEFGCAAVDRGANAPNVFVDPKSRESGLPPFSTGVRDDRMQRRTLEAVLMHFGEAANNPVSPLYGGPMLEAADAWCWDARPYPAFPAKADVWADAGAWASGHWLNGRLGGETRDLLAAILMRGGLDPESFEVGAVQGEIAGYVIDRPMRVRDGIAPLSAALGLNIAERNGRVALVEDRPAVAALMLEDLALPDDGGPVAATRSLEPRPGAARVRFIDETADYQTGSVVVRSDGEAGGVDADLPAVCGRALAKAAARRLLASEGGGERLAVSLDPLSTLRLEPADVVTVEGHGGDWRVVRIEWDEAPRATLEPVIEVPADAEIPDWRPTEPVGAVGAPFVAILDLPPLPGREEDARPVVAVSAQPWRPMSVHGGTLAASLELRATLTQPATVGTLVAALGPGVRHRWDEAQTIVVRVEGRAPESQSEEAVLAGANALAVQTARGWEIVQYRTATLVGADVWQLSGLLRAQQGTDAEMAAGASAGAVVVFLDAAIGRLNSPRGERGLPRLWRAGPAGLPPGGKGFAEVAAVIAGLHDRPWSPAHLTVVEGEDGLRIGWQPRARLFGDSWEVEATGDAMRFRVRVLDGPVERRVFEVEATQALYAAEEVAADFPAGLTGAVARVSQWGEGFGWGTEAGVSLF
ncbi:glycoside hydrolase TIM-barrel-like domain-containing protein [Brevundimonas vitis]|uniref:Glycoside hydrolase TIM-barrel-like domain-containing protein n=2 Tax=Brevundimonas vitisensis TaxID=2800818 RepID=A0ABX7BTA8_9CAUL|nr:glycoside hydrolase TIM-barrel-like domain-containing protein [Brevundimonas vitisensis]